MTFTDAIRTIFLSPEEARLRAGWRIAVQMAIMLIFVIFFSCGLGVIMLVAPDTQWVALAMILGTGLPVLISVLVARKLIDRRSIVSLGLETNQRALTDVLVGIGIAAIQIGLIFGLEYAFGWMQVAGYAWQEQSVWGVAGSIVLWLLLFAAVGFYEELLSRGYHLQNLEEGTNTFWAVVISSVVFGVGHVFNPNAGWISTLGIVLAGFYLAFGYLRTRQLWLPIGVHIGWNFFLGPVFGFPVSGLDSWHLLSLDVSGPEWITGGAFGPEAGVVGLAAQVVGAGLIWMYTRKTVVEINNPLLSASPTSSPFEKGEDNSE